MINEDRLHKALIYLSTTDEPCADLKMEVERAEYRAKATKDAVFLHSEGTVAERTAAAGIAKSYTDALDEYFEKMRAHDAMRNKRRTEEIVIEVWRSLESSRRKAI